MATPILEEYQIACSTEIRPYPPLFILWSVMRAPLYIYIPLPTSTVSPGLHKPSSKATMIEATLKVEPGSISSATAWFFVSPYTPSRIRPIFVIALISPVSTSITTAVPDSASIAFNLSTNDFSVISCILISIVVRISMPSTGSTSITFVQPPPTRRTELNPACPRRSESYCNSNPFFPFVVPPSSISP